MSNIKTKKDGWHRYTKGVEFWNYGRICAYVRLVPETSKYIVTGDIIIDTEFDLQRDAKKLLK